MNKKRKKQISKKPTKATILAAALEQDAAKIGGLIIDGINAASTLLVPPKEDPASKITIYLVGFTNGRMDGFCDNCYKDIQPARLHQSILQSMSMKNIRPMFVISYLCDECAGDNAIFA